MDGSAEGRRLRTMPVDELVAALEEEDEDLDDLVEIELQRRTLAQLRVTNVVLVLLLALATAGLVLAVLALLGVVGQTGRTNPLHTHTTRRDWIAWVPERPAFLRR